MQEVNQGNLSVSCAIQEHWAEGVVYLITLKNGNMSVSITNYGCIITAIYTPSRDGDLKNIVAGYPSLDGYRQNEHYFGCLLGRYANRIAGAQFKLGTEVYQLSQNDGSNHLHGGFAGFNKKLFGLSSLIQEEQEAGVIFEYQSFDGEEGYPGNLSIKIKYVLNKNNQLVMSYEAVTDKPTPVNLANHSYFNLTGFETPDILSHTLQINAQSYTETDQDIPTGKSLKLAGTRYDFSAPRKIRNPETTSQDYNQNFIIDGFIPGKIKKAATMSDPGSGRYVTVYTDQPGLQVYNATIWDGTILGSQGKYYQQYGAIALEAQNFPDAPNHPGFPNPILYPADTYRATTIYEFGNE
ncbi:MAG: aldose epimerase family protein [Mucilaginibacter sp.]|uniref:aldose epimerase family protein n=1 Tax=Mucilaginibacter sp. TaxID=1882438 RepID=UPI00319ECB58